MMVLINNRRVTGGFNLYFLCVVLLKCVSLKVFYFFLKLALYTNVFNHFNKVEGDRSLCLLGFGGFFFLHNLKWCRSGYVNQVSKGGICKK